MSSSRWPTPNELNGLFRGPLSYEIKSGLHPTMTLQVLCVNAPSGFGFLWLPVVCESWFLCVYVQLWCSFFSSSSCLVVLSSYDLVLIYLIIPRMSVCFLKRNRVWIWIGGEVRSNWEE